MANTDNRITADPSGSLENLSSTCGVQARSTGIAAFVVQFACLVVSCGLVICMFFHVGGISFLGFQRGHVEASTPTPHIGNTTDPVQEILGQSDTTIENFNESTEVFTEMANVTLNFGGERGTKLDLLELIRVSSLAYVAICILWFISLVFLLLSIKWEITDFVVINAFNMTIAFLYGTAHALLIAVLLFYQTENMRWSKLLLICVTVAGMLLASIAELIALGFIVKWFKYITYMTGEQSCRCVAGIASLIKRNRRNQRANDEYAIPEATQPSNVPYIDEHVQHFHHL
ncbi:hypothetical protein QR680_002169 [Steinernema hermaphroditum]|uniref:Uncharacterized protein n=1 Tax=Steinernema hermaphroditum TaxID=289476 RepID=A0AA39H1L2_9BILA|nr:hypothetical protein QR680_002169 [Steinernema hermaphroditum]